MNKLKMVLSDLQNVCLDYLEEYHKGDFYFLKCLHSFISNNIFKKHEKLCENNDYCYIEMLTEKNNTLKYSEGAKSLKIPYIIYAD